MSDIELRFLGEFQVLRDGKAMALPPSKKTRALLAYLSLNARRFRRDFLCELLWEIPDDPRGSLRWSLSKLRGLVDDDEHRRIVADRNVVAFDGDDVRIDVLDLAAVAENGIDSATTEELESVVAKYQGNFLEDLELANFHDFHAWYVAESGRMVQLQERILDELVRRFGAEPGRALPYAQSLVSLSPYNEAYRGHLIRFLVDLKRRKEAHQQFQLGMKILAEVNETPSGIMQAAIHGSGLNPLAREVRQEPAVGTDVRIEAQCDDPIGREQETALLAELMDDVASAKQARFVLLVGEPGIGKSRLIEWIARLVGCSDACLLQASAYESEAIRPFAMWIDALARSDPGAVGEMFGAREGENRDYLFDGLSRYISVQCADRPTVLVFDDLHWSDESSAAALHYVARMNRAQPLLGILGAREGELHDNKPVEQLLRGLSHDGLLQTIRVEPLTENSIRQLVCRVAPDVDPDHLGRECGGNPLFAIELARAQQEGSSGHSLNELVRERLSRLDTDGGEVLRWASVLSPRIDITRLIELTGLDEDRIGSALEMAEGHGMLTVVGEGLRFPHDLIAKAVYNDISPLRRQVMHRRIAELVEQSAKADLGLAAELAHHAINSSDAGLGASALATAGQMCLRFFANDEALSLARRGLEIAERLGDAERVRVSIDLHNVRLSAAPLDDWQSAAEKYSELAEQALDHGQLPHARLGYQMAAYVRWTHGQWKGAREESMQAERIARGSSEEEHIIGMAETAKCLAMLERDLSQAEALVMEAGAMAERNRFSYYAIPIATGMLRYIEGRLDEAEELFKDARMLCKSAGDRVSEFQANEYLVMIDLQRGDYRCALGRSQELLRLGENLREGSEEPFARSLLGICRYGLDDDEVLLEDGVAGLRSVDAKYRLSYSQLRAALLDVEKQRYQKAIGRATEALECAVILERSTEALLSHVIMSIAHDSLGNVEEAEHHSREAGRVDNGNVAVWALEAASSLAQSGQVVG